MPNVPPTIDQRLNDCQHAKDAVEAAITVKNQTDSDLADAQAKAANQNAEVQRLSTDLAAKLQLLKQVEDLYFKPGGEIPPELQLVLQTTPPARPAKKSA